MKMRLVRLGLFLTFLSLLCLAVTHETLAQGKQGKGVEKVSEKDKEGGRSNSKILAIFKEVVAKPALCTCCVLADGKEAALGTVVTEDGFILSKWSELKGKIVCKLRDGREAEAKVVGIHEGHDLCMLKIELKGLVVVEWCESKCCPVGGWVASPGLGDEPVAVGVLSVASRALNTKAAPPIANPNGGYLGISLDQNDTGAKVSQVMTGTGAEKAGVKVNDLILKVDKKMVESPDELIGLLSKYKPGDEVVLKVKRGDNELELKATLGKRPANTSRGDFQNSLGSELSSRRTGFPTIFQHDSVIKPQHCGGPICDLDGKVIGINVARAGRTESYAVPSEAILPLLKDLMSGKLAPKEDPLKKVNEAKAALDKAEAERVAAEKKLGEAKTAIDKAQAEKDLLDKKLVEARAALKKLEAEKAAAEKKVNDAKSALEQAEKK